MFRRGLAERGSNRPTATRNRLPATAVRYDRLLALLDQDQRRAVIGLALDERRPWMLRAMLGRKPIRDDQRERAALLSALDVLM